MTQVSYVVGHFSHQYTATYCNILQQIATCCNILQYTATCCNALQHAASAGTCSRYILRTIDPFVGLFSYRYVSFDIFICCCSMCTWHHCWAQLSCICRYFSIYRYASVDIFPNFYFAFDMFHWNFSTYLIYLF